MASGVKNGKVSDVVYRVQGCLGHLMYKVNLHSGREIFRTHARSKASESVSISISYFSIYLSNSSVPNTLRIFNSWSSLSDPRKKCSRRNIYSIFSSRGDMDNEAHTNQRGEHAANAPHVQVVVIAFVANQKFRAFVVPAADSDMVVCARMVELCQAPVNQT